MLTEIGFERKYLELLVEELDIPSSHYRRATDRHRSLAEWLCRKESRLAQFQPHVSPQGSFRHGTVVRPLVVGAEYDLDNVTTLVMSKANVTQKQLKDLYRLEMRDYATAHGMSAPVEDKNRCCRLRYSDEAKFHLDSVPSLVEEDRVVMALKARGIDEEIASRAISITDKRHPEYSSITRTWFSSNPRGFARWFEARMRPFAKSRLSELVALRAYATVDDVPAYEWKTPLQRAIQLLKRHRDVMFESAPEVAPISMIITNLAAHAYNGETDLWLAVRGILSRMLTFVRQNRPRVPNPADPAEDYADRWSRDPRLELNFRKWHAQATRDFDQLSTLIDATVLPGATRRTFKLELNERQLKTLGLQSSPRPASVTAAAPVVHIPSAARPWGDVG